MGISRWRAWGVASPRLIANAQWEAPGPRRRLVASTTGLRAPPPLCARRRCRRRQLVLGSRDYHMAGPALLQLTENLSCVVGAHDNRRLARRITIRESRRPKNGRLDGALQGAALAGADTGHEPKTVVGVVDVLWGPNPAQHQGWLASQEPQGRGNGRRCERPILRVHWVPCVVLHRPEQVCGEGPPDSAARAEVLLPYGRQTALAIIVPPGLAAPPPLTPAPPGSQAHADGPL